MATETAARAGQPAPDAPDGGDYETFCAALSASARGRAFLTEYTRRNRNADTEQLLAAIAQLQQTVAANSAPKVTDTIKAELRALLDDIAAAQIELESTIVATKATKLAELIALVARRITAIMALAPIEGPPPAEATQPSLPQKSRQEPKAEVKGSRRAHASCRGADARAARTADSLAAGHTTAVNRSCAQRDDHDGGDVCRPRAGRPERKTSDDRTRRTENRTRGIAARADRSGHKTAETGRPAGINHGLN